MTETPCFSTKNDPSCVCKTSQPTHCADVLESQADLPVSISIEILSLSNS